MLNGPYKFYHESGILQQEGIYNSNENFESIGKSYYESGQLREEIDYDDGTGAGSAYAPDGRPLGTVLYENNADVVGGTCPDGREWTAEEVFYFDNNVGEDVICE
jgi:antitoxin component YwqK of YwqJK toxin-antitoxin module